MDTKKLRQKILDLAIHGKTRPSRTRMMKPASVLLATYQGRKGATDKRG